MQQECLECLGFLVSGRALPPQATCTPSPSFALDSVLLPCSLSPCVDLQHYIQQAGRLVPTSAPAEVAHEPLTRAPAYFCP